MSRPSKDNYVGRRASRLKTKSEPGDRVPPLARVYRDRPDMGFDADYEPAINETPRKKHRIRYETRVTEIQLGLSPARYHLETYYA
jgi:hypothetical protein